MADLDKQYNVTVDLTQGTQGVVVSSTTLSVQQVAATTFLTGPTGPAGAKGDTGAAGIGIPVGGTTGQTLVKNSATNYDTTWSTPISSPVQSVAGKTGTVTLTKSDVGLANVDNTSDANKPVSTAQQTALNTKEPTITAGTTAQYYRGDKTFQTLDKTAVGLGNVDNTSDANKPISTATQTALSGKAATAHTHVISEVMSLQSSLDSKMVKGELVLNVKDYGALGDDVTDDTTAIQSAINATPDGGILHFPRGKYRTTSPLYVTRGVTIRMTQGLRWRYILAPNTYIKPRSTFTGTAVIIMQDKEQGGYASEQGGQRFIDVNIDMSALTSGSAVGILASGLIRDVRMDNVSISYARGAAIQTVSYVRADSSVNYPRGWQLSHVVADTGFSHGFNLKAMTDAVFIDCLAVGQTGGSGFFLTDTGENQYIGLRAVFNSQNGFNINGTTYGNNTFSSCSTDHNNLSGVLITATNKFPITFNGLALRRDGRNNGAGDGNLAGIELLNSSAPVYLDGISIVPGIDDTGTGANTPQIGLKATNSNVYVTSGELWGITSAFTDSGTNANLIINPAVGLATGILANKVTTKAGGTETTGYVLTANGAGKTPTWQAATGGGGGGGGTDRIHNLTTDTVVKTASFTVSVNTKVQANTAGGNITATFPTTATLGDAVFIQKTDDPNTNILFLAGSINGSTSANIPIRTALQGKLLQWDGTYWQVIAGDLNLAATDARYLADSTTTKKGLIQLAGDLGGTADTPYILGGGIMTFNYVPNPSFEVDYASWTFYGSYGSITRDNTVTQSGTWSSKHANTSAGDGGLRSAAIYLAPDTYTFTVYRQLGTGVTNAHAVVRTVSGGAVAFQSNTGYTGIDTMTQVGGNFTVSTGQNYEILIGQGSYGATSNGTVYFDAIAIQNGSGQTVYFDGSTPTAGGVSYGWQGTAHNSTSTKQARARLQNTDQLPEGTTNLYATTIRSRSAISLTTTGTSGAATYNATTGVINVPQYTGGSGITRSVINTSGAYTIAAVTNTDYVYVITAAHTGTLPTASGNTNLYTFKNRHTAAVTVSRAGSDTIEGDTLVTIQPSDSVDLISNGSAEWEII